MKALQTLLSDFGISLQWLVTGCIGALVKIGKMRKEGKQMDKVVSVVSVLIGMLSANYLTPIVLLFLKVQDNAVFGVAFVCGYFSHELIDWGWKILKKKADDTL